MWMLRAGMFVPIEYFKQGLFASELGLIENEPAGIGRGQYHVQAFPGIVVERGAKPGNKVA
jgi:hypothetical protein